MFAPNSLTAAEISIARKPMLGGEVRVKLTREPYYEIGVVDIRAADSGIMTANSWEASALQDDPKDLIVVADDSVFADSRDLVLTFGVTFSDNTTGTATATFKVPGYARVTERLFQAGWAVDVVPSSAKKIKTITLTGVTADDAAEGARFAICALPDLTKFTLVGTVTDKSFNTKSRMPEAIPDGMDESAFVKPGVLKKGEIKIKSKWVSFAEGLARFDGATCVALVETAKERKVTTERIFFLNTVVKTDMSAGELASQGEFSADGMYERMGVMVPQQA